MYPKLPLYLEKSLCQMPPFNERFALVKYGGGIIGMSGSIAGNTHARNRSGNYVRARTKPVNPNTARQQAVRSALAELTTQWAQTLSAAQRTAWNLYASSVSMKNKLGETINLTGFNHYIRSNLMRNRAGLGVVDDGPVIFELPAADPSFAVTASEATQEISFAYDDTMDWADENGGWLILHQGQPQNAQRNFFAGPWRYCSIVEGVNGAPPAGPKVASVPYAISEGQRIWCYARIIRADGRISEVFTANCFCAA